MLTNLIANPVRYSPAVRGIVDLHSGKIWVDSTGVAGDGSTFHVGIVLAPKVSASSGKN
ncbi:MAG: hypothetical protein ABR537_03060 [Gemmatimonadales bacterium]|nr:hypothetical protein [Myxococcales bacterium]